MDELKRENDELKKEIKKYKKLSSKKMNKNCNSKNLKLNSTDDNTIGKVDKPNTEHEKNKDSILFTPSQDAEKDEPLPCEQLRNSMNTTSFPLDVNNGNEQSPNETDNTLNKPKIHIKGDEQ